MTKRDFELIATALRGTKDEISDTAHYYVAKALANALEDVNPRFDRARFLKACGVVDA